MLWSVVSSDSDAYVASSYRDGFVQFAVDSPGVGDSLVYPFNDQSNQDPLYFNNNAPLKLNDPANIQTGVTFVPDTGKGTYLVEQKLGNGLDYRPPMELTFEEYMYYDMKKSARDYWRQRVHADAQNQDRGSRDLIPPIKINSEAFDRIFGGGTIEIRPQGSAELIFGVNVNRTDNPALPERQRRVSTFDFDEKIQLNVVGKIGEKLKLTTNYNTESTFDFENQMKLEYTGFEDEIIRKIEAGNVNFGLNTSLITGSQSLFGLKTQLQFGRLSVTSVISQERGKKSEVNVTGGAQVSNFEVIGDNYEANRHFFLSQYFYNNYDIALSTLPVINSGVQITRMEVWVTNRTGVVENTRNVVALTDLGEDVLEKIGTGFIVDSTNLNIPDNGNNNLYYLMTNNYSLLRDINTPLQSTFAPLQTGFGYTQAVNYERVNNARKLQTTEYTFNERLGFISLNQALNFDEVLAVAYQYTLNGVTYQVGEFSTDGVIGQEALILKLLKSTNNVPKVIDAAGTGFEFLLWDLMMKNIYSIGAFQVNSQDFQLQVWYNNPSTGTDIPFIAEGPINGQPLIQVFRLDQLNQQQQASPDGQFDFLDRVTIYATNGRVIFPMKEPFGKFLESRFAGDPNEAQLILKYSYQQLYDSTKVTAQTAFAGKNRFKLKGSYKSSSNSDISLNAVNVPQGSVQVTAGGAPLQENVDYTVDYTLGRVKIINESILNSGVPIKISLESNSLFNLQSKTLFGTHFDYRVNRDFNVGATIMNLTERPVTQKINIGDEPMSNTMLGFDLNYRADVPFLTRMIDKLPLLETKAPSSITATAEYAQLIPGHNRAIGRNGNSYIDDFEGTQSAIDIRAPQGWSIASVPQGQPTRFPEAANGSLLSGMNRAGLSWYVIDPLFLLANNNLRPSHLTPADQSDHRVRQVLETEVFPNRQPPNGQPFPIAMLDLSYSPDQRGPYNFDAAPRPGLTAGIAADGTLNDPASRWAGIQRSISTNDFQAANIEFIQIWVMDPYNDDVPLSERNTTGELVINLGNISEDVLKDSRNAFENGLPTSTPLTLIDSTDWGRVPVVQSIVNAFDNDPQKRALQDVGLDGLGDNDETSYFSDYLQNIDSIYPGGSPAYDSAVKDPAGDNYHYYRGTDYDNNSYSVLRRYKYFNGLDGNSPEVGQPNDEGFTEDYPTQSTTLPNQEDINRDNTLNETESYYEYRIKLTPNDINPNNVGNNYITDKLVRTVTTLDGRSRSITWYQLRIPVRNYTQRVGNIEGYNSIRFIRMYFKDVDKPVVCRFARLEFIRSDWRKYEYSLLRPGEYISNDQNTTQFDVAAVNIEENGSRTPVSYVLPPGIVREQNVQSSTLVRLNEQSLSLRTCNLEDGDARAVFRTVNNMDVRSYQKLRMFFHAERNAGSTQPLNNGELVAFIRIGMDQTDNYYEYEIPLEVTPDGVYSDADAEKVWPLSNTMELPFELLQLVKQQRNIAQASGQIAVTQEYSISDPNNPGRRVSVKGNPNLAMIRVFTLGVRNPKKTSATPNDDGLPKCGEIWFNELRLTDFVEDGGWAATARVTARLADLGVVNFSGNMATPNFGSIEKKVSERLREQQVNYDISTQLELGRFFNEELGISLPFFWGYGETYITPQFNPLDPDILLKPLVGSESLLSPDQRDSLKGAAIDYTRRRSYNFTNIHKERGKDKKKQCPWDIENFSLSYAYTEIYRHNVNIEYSSLRNYRGQLTYSYTPQVKPIRPFEKAAWAQSKWMTLIREISVAPLPANLAVSTDLNRSFSEIKNRNITGFGDIFVPTNFNKNFLWSRNYDLRWDLTKNLKFDFTADNQAQVLEPFGRIDTDQKRDSLIDNLRGLGTTMAYHHQANVNYTIPINKVPILDWLSASARYSAGYTWTRAPLSTGDSLGNVVGNNAQWQLTGQANMTSLYNKIPYFKKVNQKRIGGTTQERPNPRNPRNANQNGPNADSTQTPKKGNDQYLITDYLARLVMSLRTVSVNYTENATLSLPGYKPTSRLLGMDDRFDGPGWGFVFGQQKGFGPGNSEFPVYAESQGWLVATQSLFVPFTKGNTQTLTGRAQLEPFPDLKIELNISKNTSLNKTAFYRYDPSLQDWTEQSPVENGSFSMSIITWRTAFQREDRETRNSRVFQQLLDNRAIISERAGSDNPNSGGIGGDGFADGYSKASQDVLIPAFLAAYSGRRAETQSLSPFPAIPLPNWRITYDGLIKYPKIKKRFKAFTLGHTYRSTYSLGGYVTNLNFFDADRDGFSNIRNITNDFESKYQFSTVQISEQFSPLVSVDMTWTNSLMTRVEYKKDRTLSLSLANTQLTEVSGRELVVGLGYRFDEVELKFLKNVFKKSGPPKSAMNLRVDVSYRNNQTVIRRSIEEINVLTAGQNILSIKTSIDYQLTKDLMIRGFFDRVMTSPLISSSFKTANTNAGISLRFTLGQ